MMVNVIAAGSGFVDEVKYGQRMRLPNFPDCFFQIGEVTTDSALEPDMCVPFTFDQGNLGSVAAGNISVPRFMW